MFLKNMSCNSQNYNDTTKKVKLKDDKILYLQRILGIIPSCDQKH